MPVDVPVDDADRDDERVSLADVRLDRFDERELVAVPEEELVPVEARDDRPDELPREDDREPLLEPDPEDDPELPDERDPEDEREPDERDREEERLERCRDFEAVPPPEPAEEPLRFESSVAHASREGSPFRRFET